MRKSSHTVNGLIFGCPLMDKKLMEHCVFNKIWQLEPRKRHNFVRNLNSEEIDELEKFHYLMECKNQYTLNISEHIIDLIDSL